MANYPQIVTEIGDFGVDITTQIDAPWVDVTSVNGMTGDVVVDSQVNEFETNHYYKENSLVIYQGQLYYAKQDFTSGASFDANDWNTANFAQEQADWAENDNTKKSYIKNKPTLAEVATSGEYSDLEGTPTLAEVATSGDYEDLENAPELAEVATSGSYTDLVNTPSINNGTLTIQQNGTTVETFSANSSDSKTANIVVPTDTSDLSNGAGYLKTEDLVPGWSRFVSREITGGSSGTWTTRGGRVLRYWKTNGGAGIRLYDCDDIRMLKYHFSVMASGENRWTGTYRVGGVKAGSTVYSRIYRKFSDGTASGGNEEQHIVDAQSDYVEIVDVSGSKAATAGEFTCICVDADSSADVMVWQVFGTFGSMGALDSASFQAEIRTDYGVLPCFYQSGANENTTGAVFVEIEIFEDNVAEES